MSKLIDYQVKLYQYGNPKEIRSVLDFCAQNQSWPRSSDKETIERMIIAAGLKTRRFINERDGDYADSSVIEDTFKYIWFPIADYEPSYLTYGTIAEFKTELYQESSVSGYINQVIHRVDNTSANKKQQNQNNGMQNNPHFQTGGGEGDDGGGGGGYGGGRGGAGGGRGQNTNHLSRKEREKLEGENTYDLDVDGDPYEHPHKPCGCKHCNQGGKVRCHICGDELTEKDMKKIREEEEKKNGSKKEAEERERRAKLKEEANKKAVEEKARKLAEKEAKQAQKK